MKIFIKKYKELLIVLVPFCFITANWYSSMRLNEDWSAMIPYKGYEFLFYNRGGSFSFSIFVDRYYSNDGTEVSVTLHMFYYRTCFLCILFIDLSRYIYRDLYS